MKTKDISTSEKVVIVIGILVVAVILTFGIIAIVNSIEPPVGNTNTNLANHGMVVEYEGDVYYNNNGLMRLSDQEQIAAVNTSYLNIVGDKIYYSNLDDARKIYSMNLDGSDNKALNDLRATYVTVVGDKIFFVATFDVEGRGIYSMNLDGSDCQMIFEGEATCLQYYKNKIYFLNIDDGYSTYSMNLDGSDLKQEIAESGIYINVVDDTIYYCKTAGVYKWKMGEQYVTKLTDQAASYLNVSGDYIYFSFYNLYVNAENGKQGIFRMTTDGEDITQIAGLAAVGLCVVDDKIYFQDVGDEFALKRVNVDGSSEDYEIVPGGTYVPDDSGDSSSEEATASPEPSAAASSEATASPEPSAAASSEATASPEPSAAASSEATASPEPSAAASSEVTASPEPSAAA